MVQSTEEIRLKAIIKRRDARIEELKKIVKESENREHRTCIEIRILQEQQQDFKDTLIKFLDLDQHIRNVVRDSL